MKTEESASSTSLDTEMRVQRRKMKKQMNESCVKILKVEPREFKSLVQRMTGRPPPRNDDDQKPSQILRPTPKRPAASFCPVVPLDLFESAVFPATVNGGAGLMKSCGFRRELEMQKKQKEWSACFTPLEDFLEHSSPRWAENRNMLLL